MDLTGKTALVTGASRGIGRECAIRLAQCGASVAINYLSNDEAAKEVEAEVLALGVKALRAPCSIADFDATVEMTAKVKKELGPIDILVNNAGILSDKVFVNMDPADWTEVINTNLVGVFNVSRNVAFSMMRKRRGRIINMASLNAIIGSPGQTNYTASKAGVIGFTKSLARELAPFNINVNAIAPGYIETEMLKNIPEETLKHNMSYIPLARLGRAQEVADVMLFLASELSSYLTGQVINVDGGIS
ncbi:MAG: 3-oxoacyl-[acyl-carrier-protein] reductase [Proteobacteria bacterium]|nr:3-oxoacyl-[acyl-carrier-protein] reductase [Pseudomonadota bacterium]